MPDITLPEVKLPDIKLPDGLREMNKRDIQNTLGDRMPRKVEMPDIDLSKVEIPKAVDDRLKRVEKWVDSVDLAKIDLTKTGPGKALDRRLNPRRPNPLLPIAALIAVLSAMAAALWLVTSPTAASRVRESADRTWRKITGQPTDVIRRDDDADLASLLDPDATTIGSADLASPIDAATWPGTGSDVDGIVGVAVTDISVEEADQPTGV